MFKKIFSNNYRQAIGIVLLVAAGLIAAGKTYQKHTDLCDEINKKVDREIYQNDLKHLDEKLKSIKEQLDRLEGKIDGIILGKYKTDTTNIRDSQPGDSV